MPRGVPRTKSPLQPCGKCGFPDLAWKIVYSDGRYHTAMVDRNGNPHLCGVDLASVEATLLGFMALETRNQVTLATDAIRERLADATDKIEGYTDGARKLADRYQDNLAQARVDAASVARSVISQARNELDAKITDIPELVRSEVSRLVPVRHEVAVTYPDGHAVAIEGRPHKRLPLLLSVLSLRMHVMLVGPAGSGKTTAAFQAAALLELPYHEKSMGPATSQWDLLGYLSPDGKYVPGIMRSPYEHGGLLMLDEIDNSNPNVLTAINAPIANGHCSFPDGMVVRNDDFVMVGAGNTYGRGADRMYVGRQQLDAATLDRFVVINWDYDEGAEMAWVTGGAGGASASDPIWDNWYCNDCHCRPTAWVEYVQRVRATADKHRMRVIVSPRASIAGSKLLAAHIRPSVVAEMVLWKGIGGDDRAKIERECGMAVA